MIIAASYQLAWPYFGSELLIQSNLKSINRIMSLPCLKPLLRKKPELPNVINKALQALALPPPLTSPPHWPSAPATWAPCWGLSQGPPCLRALHCCPLCLDCFLPDSHLALCLIIFRSLSKCHFFQEAFTEHPKVKLSHLLSSYSCFIFVHGRKLYLLYIINMYLFVSVLCIFHTEVQAPGEKGFLFCSVLHP